MFQYCLESVMETNARSFDSCLAAVLRENKGYAPGDAAGPTNHGITQAVYSLWREEQLLPDKEVWKISFEEVESIYQRDFWIPSHAAECPAPLNLLVFKCAVESGARWAVKTLQQCLGMPRNGTFGQATRVAVKSCNGYEIAVRFLEARIVHYQDLCKKDLDRQAHLSTRLVQLEAFLPTLCHLQELSQDTSEAGKRNIQEMHKGLLPDVRSQRRVDFVSVP